MVAMHRSYIVGCGRVHLLAAVLFFHLCVWSSSLAAPTSHDSLLSQPSEIAEYFSDLSGCYYNFQRYDEGDRIVTNEPCLNCTCHNRMLMCYLRVCPFTRAVGPDCTIEKKSDQCCPVITCPEVPVKLLTSSTTSSPTPTTVPVKLLTSSTTTSLTSTTPTTELGFHDNYGCNIENSFYADGAQVLSDPEKPCELCYCIRNRTVCVMQECTLHVDGCKPVYHDGVCCPVRYDCGEGVTATVWPSISSMIQSKPTTPQSAEEIIPETEKIDVTERFSTTYNEPSSPQPVPQTSKAQQPSFEGNRNTITVRDFDRTTTVLADEGVTKFGPEKSTARVPVEYTHDEVTENMNTVSDRNTQPLVHESSTSLKIPNVEQSEAVRPEVTSEKVVYTETTEEQATSAGIPGEGNCLVDGITYLNGSVIESSNPCHAKCICMSSIPTCTLVHCSQPPTDPKCMPVQIKPESCCPVYICAGNERHPPLVIPSHNQVVPDQSDPISSQSSMSEESETVEQPQPEKSTEAAPAGPISDSLGNEASHDDGSIPEIERPTSEIPVKDSSYEVQSSVAASTKIPPHHDVSSSDALAPSDKEPVLVDDTTEYVQVTVKPEKVAHPTIAPSQESLKPFSNKYEPENGVENEVPTTTPYPEGELTTGLKYNFTESLVSKGTTAAINYENTEASMQADVEIVSEKYTTTHAPVSAASYTPLSVPAATVTIHDQDQNQGQAGVGETTTAALYESNEILASSESPVPAPSNEKADSTYAPIEPTKIIVEDLSDSQSTEHIGVTSHSVLWNEAGAGIFEEHSELTHNVVSSSPVLDATSHNGQEYVVSTTGVSTESSEAGNNNTFSPEVNYESSIGAAAIEEVSANTVVPEVESPTTEGAEESQDGSHVTSVRPEAEGEMEHIDHVEHSGEAATTVPSETPQFSSSSEYSIQADISSTESVAPEGADKISNGVQELGVTTAATVENVVTTEVEYETSPPRPSEPTKLSAEGFQTTAHPVPSEAPIDTNDISSTEKEVDLTTAAAEVSSEATTVTESYTKEASQASFSTTAASSTEYEEVKTIIPSLLPSTESPASSLPEKQQHPVEVITIASSPPYDVATTKVPESNEITSESEPVMSPDTHTPLSLPSASPSAISETYSSSSDMPIETKLNETEKQALNVTEFTTESGYTMIQQSTWSVKPFDQESTSEAYYPHQPVYPTGGVDNNGGAVGGTDNTSMEEYDEDPNAFGPGTCRYGGKLYVSAQQIPRDDPCDFCFCFRSDIICLQQSCPPPIHGCRQEPIQGFCCPRYECPVARDILFNATTPPTSTTARALPLRARPSETHRGGARKNGCVINGYFYNVGDDIAIASGPCLECMCGSDGRMKCDPKSCSPEPFARQLMAEAASKR